MRERNTLLLNRHQIEITHPDKIMFPRSGTTKADLIAYYTKMSPIIVHYLRNRPLTLHRFVDGVTNEGFYQKNASSYFPSWIKWVSIPKKNKTPVHYVVCNNAATLAYLANQCVVEFHPWLSQYDKPTKPDRMIFDLDPSGTASFRLVVQIALILREMLHTLGLPSFVMTTGSRGLHVVVPLKRLYTFEVIRSFARDIAGHIVLLYPEKATIEMRIANRGNRIFIDTLRNGFTQTGIAPYSVRARKYASVATPLRWNELNNRHLTSDYYTIDTIGKRLTHTKDPWHMMQKEAQSLSAAIKKIKSSL